MVTQPLFANSDPTQSTPTSLTAYVVKQHSHLALMVAYARYRNDMKLLDFDLKMVDRSIDLAVNMFNNPNSVSILPALDAVQIMVNSGRHYVTSYAYSGPLVGYMMHDQQNSPQINYDLAIALEEILNTETSLIKGSILVGGGRSVEDCWLRSTLMAQYSQSSVGWPIRLIPVDKVDVKNVKTDGTYNNVYVGPIWMDDSDGTDQLTYLTTPMNNDIAPYRDVFITNLAASEVNKNALDEWMFYMSKSATDIASAASQKGIALDSLVLDLQTAFTDIDKNNLLATILATQDVNKEQLFDAVSKSYMPNKIASQELDYVWSNGSKANKSAYNISFEELSTTGWIAVKTTEQP